MARKLSESQIQQRERLIRYYVKKRYSANLIQQKLKEKGLGMRRKELLAKVRKAKGISIRSRSERHIPVRYVTLAEKRGISRFVGKWIAVYGTVDGKSRRIEMGGSGRALYNAMIKVARHPPKKRFVRCYAGEAPIYLDYAEKWDEHPAVIS